MSDAPASKPVSRWFWALLAAGLVARAACLTSASLWTDEASTIVVARFPVGQIVSVLKSITGIESTPPLHFILVHFFLRACPDGLLAIRLLSLLCGAACLALFWRLATRLCPGRTLAPMALACAASSWIHASQDGRAYSLVLLLALCDLILAWDLAREWSAGKAAGLAAVASLGLCAHYHFGLLVAGNAVFFALRFRRRARDLALRLTTLIPTART